MAFIVITGKALTLGMSTLPFRNSRCIITNIERLYQQIASSQVFQAQNRRLSIPVGYSFVGWVVLFYASR